MDDAVDTVLAAVRYGERGDTFVPNVPSARVVDIAAALIEDRPIETKITGIRPGEKVHEILISEEEAPRTHSRSGWYVIRSMLPEISNGRRSRQALAREYSSAHHLLTQEETYHLLQDRELLVDDLVAVGPELLR
jgi:UDP-glucose 4-epimerase